MSEYEEQWVIYPGHIGEDFAMFAVNLGPNDDAPFDNLRWLNVVRFNFDALPSGMPDSDTNRFLYEVEERVATRAASRGGVQVGRLTVDGRRELFFYAATDEREIVLRDVHDEFGELDLDVLGQLDPEWKVYRDFLYPQPVDFQRIHNQRVVRLLGEHGDVAEIPRQIDHNAFFPDENSRRKFAREVAQSGFEIEAEKESDEGKLRFGLSFTSFDPVDLATIDQVTVGLFMRAAELGGVYDGWGCAVHSGVDDDEQE